MLIIHVKQLGKSLATIIGGEHGTKIKKSLRGCVSGIRFRNILDRSFNSGNEDMTDFTRNLTNMEKELFQQGCSCARDFYRWKSRQTEKIEPSDLVFDRTKRRRTT